MAVRKERWIYLLWAMKSHFSFTAASDRDFWTREYFYDLSVILCLPAIFSTTEFGPDVNLCVSQGQLQQKTKKG